MVMLANGAIWFKGSIHFTTYFHFSGGGGEGGANTKDIVFHSDFVKSRAFNSEKDMETSLQFASLGLL